MLWAVILALTGSSALAAKPRVVFQGNAALPSAVYEAVLPLPDDAVADAATAATLVRRVKAFLRAAGYVLAEARVSVENDVITVEVDEGRLERVVFLGPLTLQRVRLALGLSVPRGIFNQPDLVEQVKRLEDELGLPIAWKLVPTREVKHSGPQIQELPAIRGVALIPPDERLELHITLGEPEWPVGLGLDLRTNYLDGIEVGLNYQGLNAGQDRSRWRLAGSIGVGVAGTIVPWVITPLFTRATLEAKWATAPLLDLGRLTLSAFGEQIGRQRLDVNLVSYQYSAGDARVSATVNGWKTLEVSIFGGIHVRGLYGFIEVPGAPSVPTGGVLLAETFGGAIAVNLSAPGTRDDWTHRLVVSGTAYVSNGALSWGETRLRYRNTFNIGWHELRLRANATAIFGNVPFHDEQALADPHLRGYFADIWVRRVGSVSAEFRFSLVRDAFLLGVFADAAVFGRYDATRTLETAGLGFATGPGAHFLIEGTITIDVMMSFGYLSGGPFRWGPMLFINKVL